MQLAQLRVEPVHLSIRVGEHEPAGVRVACTVRVPALDQRGPGRVLVRRPRHRPVAVERLYGRVEPSLGQIARGLALRIRTLPRHFGDLGRPVRLAQLDEQPARWRRAGDPRTTLAPLARASASSSPVTRLSSIAASSTISAVRL